MEVFVYWERNTSDSSSLIAKINLKPCEGKQVITNALSEKRRAENGFPNKIRVESFCTPNHHVTATRDIDPLTTLEVLINVPTALRASGKIISKATRLVYKLISRQNCTEGEWECLCLPVDSFSSLATVTVASENQATGVCFRIELDDGSELKQFDGSEYFVGSGDRKMPYCVEIPFPWPLKRLADERRILSLYRSNLFWLQPQLDCSSLEQLLHETNFLLAGLEEPGESKMHDSDGLACLMATRNQNYALRSTLFSTGTYAAIRVESSCMESPLICDLYDMIVCHMATGPDPFTAIQRTIEAQSLETSEFSSRLRKLSSGKWYSLSSTAKILTRLGYCTWDAMGHKCSETSVTTALKFLKDKQIPIGYIVVDDGWQDGGSSGPLSESDRKDRPSPKLTSFHANEKFPNSLRPLSQGGKPVVYAWMTVIGYWGGAKETCFDGDTIHLTMKMSIGLQRNQPNHTKMWERMYEIITPTGDNLEKFFTDYFTVLSAHGVTGVKIDGQSILGSFKVPDKDTCTLVKKYRDALQLAAEKVFPDELVLNSMACAKEILLHSGDELSVTNACWRTSDDHAFPGVEENDDMVAWHVLRNAMNALFLGEIFPVIDWDMFRVCDRNAYIHAVARVVSGGPVYISDSIPFDEEFRYAAFTLVRRLTTSDGRILRCLEPGRPTADCVFGDPRRGRMFKVFNRNAVSGVVGLFNLSTRETGHYVREDYSPRDVEDFRGDLRTEFISVVVGSSWRCAFRHSSSSARQAITLHPMEAAIAHVYPILHLPGGLEVVVVGRLDLLNCGGVVKSVSSWHSEDDEHTLAEVSLMDYGIMYVWLGDDAVSRLTSVTACGGRRDIVFDRIDKLSFLSVTIPATNLDDGILMRLTFRKKSAQR